jgi:hypothetical protein
MTTPQWNTIVQSRKGARHLHFHDCLLRQALMFGYFQTTGS